MSAIQELRKHAKELEDATGLSVQLTEEGNRIFVVLVKAPLPPGVFRLDATDVLFVTDQQYPLSAMDMFWAEVEVIRLDGSIPQGADATEQYLGRTWRRFSWHRGGVWNPGGNPVLDHFSFVESRWALEAAR